MFCLRQPSEVSQGSPVHLDQVIAHGLSLKGSPVGPHCKGVISHLRWPLEQLIASTRKMFCSLGLQF